MNTDLGGDPPCWAHLVDDDPTPSGSREVGQVVAVNLGATDTRGRELWVAGKSLTTVRHGHEDMAEVGPRKHDVARLIAERDRLNRARRRLIQSYDAQAVGKMVHHPGSRGVPVQRHGHRFEADRRAAERAQSLVGHCESIEPCGRRVDRVQALTISGDRQRSHRCTFEQAVVFGGGRRLRALAGGWRRGPGSDREPSMPLRGRTGQRGTQQRSQRTCMAWTRSVHVDLPHQPQQASAARPECPVPIDTACAPPCAPRRDACAGAARPAKRAAIACALVVARCRTGWRERVTGQRAPRA